MLEEWYIALFKNWFGIKLMIPFTLLFINFWIGFLGLLIWSGSYVYYVYWKGEKESK